MEINLDRTFIEKLEDIINNDILNNLYLKNHLIVFDIENDNKRKIFHDTLNNAKWIKYDEFIHEPDDNFNYLYFYGSYFDKIGLYNVLKKFNGKTIIFDNESILSKQSLINIIEGAVCSSPDSATKWPVRLEGHNEFIFTGSVIILTSQLKDKFSKTKKYEYLSRDMMKL